MAFSDNAETPRPRPAIIASALLALACVAVIIGAVLPWETIRGEQGPGMQPLAFVTIIAAILGLGLLASFIGIGPLHPRRRRFGGFELTLAVAVTAISMGDFSNFAALGAYVTMFAGAAWVVASLLSLRREKVRIA